jgi:predicted phosphodiesterase
VEEQDLRISRRNFIGMVGASTLGACARGDKKKKAEKRGKPDGHTFATVGDLHVLDARSTAIVSRCVRMINDDHRVSFTAILGDLATDGKLPELNLARSALDGLVQPYFCVPGNHDVDPTQTDDLANYENALGEARWDEGVMGWVFVGLNTCESTKSDVVVQPEEVAWLEKALRGINQRRPIALLAHHPFNPHSKAYRVKNADDVLGMFSGHNLRMVASGHFHGNQEERQDGILFTTTACCSSTRGNFDGTEAKGYRTFRVNKGEVETEFVEVGA